MYKKQLHYLKLLVCILAVFTLLTSPITISQGAFALTLQEQLDQVKAELKDIRNQKGTIKDQIANAQAQQNVYQSKAGQLRGEVESLQLDIAEQELEIKEFELGVKQIEEQIALKQAEVDTIQKELAGLEEVSYLRVDQGYKDFRTHRQNRVDLFNVKDPNTYFKDSQYRQLIQTETNKVMQEVVDLKSQLLRDKQDLQDKQIAIRRDKAVVEEKQRQLEAAEEKLKSKIYSYNTAIFTAKNSIDSAKNVLSGFNKEEAKKQARAEYLRQQIFNSFVPPKNGKYVEKGSYIGNQGSTGWSTGPHLHFMVQYNNTDRNPCNYLPAKVSSGEGSCGWGSALAWPMSGNMYYTSRYYGGGSDSRCFSYNGKWNCSSHRAIDVANSIWNAPVFAAHSGWLYKSVDQYGALFVIICEQKSCNGGFETGYWHLSKY
jgi:peptidoglycan hydrolase CwlO-like protein